MSLITSSPALIGRHMRYQSDESNASAAPGARANRVGAHPTTCSAARPSPLRSTTTVRSHTRSRAPVSSNSSSRSCRSAWQTASPTSESTQACSSSSPDCAPVRTLRTSFSSPGTNRMALSSSLLPMRSVEDSGACALLPRAALQPTENRSPSSSTGKWMPPKAVRLRLMYSSSVLAASASACAATHPPRIQSASGKRRALWCTAIASASAAATASASASAVDAAAAAAAAVPAVPFGVAIAPSRAATAAAASASAIAAA
mmetsp:Transcript_13341/g.25933  ORF Transcript_13341/g.25933 Transcript_13341/m.25933 type:complete len:260 (-) Transcript_13341:167-946(-)